MKPNAPDDVRGEFSPIQTSVPGVHICDHMPMLARQMHNAALVRSVHHSIVDHNAGAYYALTGRSPLRGSQLVISPSAEDFPPYGSVLDHLRPTGSSFPAFVHLPDIMSNNGSDLPGQRAGFMGAGSNPFVLGDPSAPGFKVKQLDLPDEIILERLRRRVDLLRDIDGSSKSTVPQAAAVRDYQQQVDIAKFSAHAMAAGFVLSSQTAYRASCRSPGSGPDSEWIECGCSPRMRHSVLTTPCCSPSRTAGERTLNDAHLYSLHTSRYRSFHCRTTLRPFTPTLSWFTRS